MDPQLGLFPELATARRAPEVRAAAVPEPLARLAERLPAAVRLGTSSWAFPGWESLVYDRRASQSTLAREGLAAYATHPLLRTVGVDRSFYRPMAVADLRAYADAVKDDFRFLVKADRLLTSPLHPDDPGLRSRNPHFLDAAYASDVVVGPMREGLGGRSGPLVFQFPPFSPNLVGGRGAFLKRLRRFLSALPPGPLYAVELRTPSLLTEAYAEILEATGVAHCYNVHPAMAPLERQLELVQPFYQPALVVRWMLGAGLGYEAAKQRYEPFNRIVDEDLASRRLIARTVLDALLGEREAFVIANNKAEGSAPLTLFRLAERIVDWTSEDARASWAG
jgi:uncharacterized protein YecE (DUF72 family)